MLNMVVASPCSHISNAKTGAQENYQIPVIDISAKDKNRSEIRNLILGACQDFGFFKVINHGVPSDVIARVEQEGLAFFSKPHASKLEAGPPNPLGYGSKKIGRCGDEGEIEYLLLRADSQDISQRSKTISHDPQNFSAAMNDYIAAVRDLASKLLDLIAESLGLEITENSVFSKLITDTESDSLIRLNHYPAAISPPHQHPPPILLPHKDCKNMDMSVPKTTQSSQWIGFGDHTDPQMLTLLRSNDVGGLQICSRDGAWVPVVPDPTAFCVNVGDVLQVCQSLFWFHT
uniref:Fe2OG dioxygenase domain-containing protein n=1 Tax=Kalanchoe fedtschenkoi TaxID=63787 RepID=A0A7N0UBK8_KALFE